MTQKEIMDLIQLRCPHCNKMDKLMEANMTVTISGNIYIDCKHCGKQSHLEMRLTPVSVEQNEWYSEPKDVINQNGDEKLLSDLFNH